MSATTSSSSIIGYLKTILSGLQTTASFTQIGVITIFSLFGINISTTDAKIIVVVMTLFMFWRYIGKITTWIGYILIAAAAFLLLGLVTV